MNTNNNPEISGENRVIIYIGKDQNMEIKGKKYVLRNGTKLRIRHPQFFSIDKLQILIESNADSLIEFILPEIDEETVFVICTNSISIENTLGSDKLSQEVQADIALAINKEE